MSDLLSTDNIAAEDSGISLILSNGDGFAWNEVIEGTVILHPHPTDTVTFSTVSVSVVEENLDGFQSPVAFAGVRDPLSPAAGFGLAGEPMPVVAPPLEVAFGETVIGRDITIPPGDSGIELPFSLPVPSGISLSSVTFVAAHAAATSGVDNDHDTATPFVLLPPRFVQAVQNSLKTFGDFETVEVSDTPQDGGNGYTFTLDYVAPEALQDRLDGVKIELIEAGEEITGVVEINPQERTLADHLKSLVHADRIQVPVSFVRAELDAAGKTNSASPVVTERLHELLDPFLNPVAP